MVSSKQFEENRRELAKLIYESEGFTEDGLLKSLKDKVGDRELEIGSEISIQQYIQDLRESGHLKLRRGVYTVVRPNY